MRKMNKSSSKQEIRKAVAQAIKEKQMELGLDKYLMNSVRLGLFTTMTRYFNNPSIIFGTEKPTTTKGGFKLMLCNDFS